MVNCAKKILRKRKKLLPMEDIAEIADYGTYAQKEEHLRLDKHLSQLEKKQQEVLKLRYYLDMDYQTIADVLKIPLGTVKSRISVGLQKTKREPGG